MKTRAIRIHETGGPEVLKWEKVELAEPGPSEVRLRQTAVGLNYIDTYHRSGLYPLELPSGLGLEAAGIVDAVGKDVTVVEEGQRVAYASPPVGAYAVQRNMPADRLVPLPEDIRERDAAAMLLQGMTAEYLLQRCYPVKSGDTVLIHAAAGGVGLLLSKWANHIGATVIGTVGNQEKAELAAKYGCAHTIVYTEQRFVDQVLEITGGEGVAVVYDSVGKDTFQGSLDCLRKQGMLVSFGQSSGPVPPLDVGELGRRGSLYLTRPSLMDYTADRNDLLNSAETVFEAVRTGAIQVEVRQTFNLDEAAEAHRALEARETTGSTLLLP